MGKFFEYGIQGFTLIELMIVISIIAILASILIPNFIQARAEAQYSACVSNEKNLAIALEMYSTDWNGIYPDPGGSTTIDSSFGSAYSFTPVYMQNVPTCPTNHLNYLYYESTADGNEFTIDQNGNAHITEPAPGTGFVDCAYAPCYGSGAGIIN